MIMRKRSQERIGDSLPRNGASSVHRTSSNNLRRLPLGGGGGGNRTTLYVRTVLILAAVLGIKVANLIYISFKHVPEHPPPELPITIVMEVATYRVFGPVPSDDEHEMLLETTDPNLPDITFQFFTRHQQIAFLMEHGHECQKEWITTTTGAAAESSTTTTTTEENLLIQRFLQLPEPYATELWKYCVLYTGIANVYWQPDNALPLYLWHHLLPPYAKNDNIGIALNKFPSYFDGIDDEDENDKDDNSQTEGDSSKENQSTLRLHHSFLHIAQPQSKVALGMMQYLSQASSTTILHPLQLAETLGKFATKDKLAQENAKVDNRQGGNGIPDEDATTIRYRWKFWTARCRALGDDDSPQLSVPDPIELRPPTFQAILAKPCPADYNNFCCQVWTTATTATHATDVTEMATGMMLRHPLLTHHTTSDPPPLPFAYQNENLALSQLTPEEVGLAEAQDIAYVATIRAFPTGAVATTDAETPNFHDIVADSNCFAENDDCFACLKSTFDDNNGGDFSMCREECPCYASLLCHVRPPPKRVVSNWRVTRPIRKKDPSRHIPRIAYQAWFESMKSETKTNTTRFVQSFKKSGWQYEFYDDDRAARFIQAHFPPEVREAYDAVIPGAVKAELFRICVLLIRGGLYANKDVLLEGNLDAIVHPSVGFMAPQDTPGSNIGQRHCLYTGFLAAAPGHPFLAKTLEHIVNQIRNRYTVADYDDMMCPDPALAVTHTADALFTAGSCILGVSVNDVLKRHRQTSFQYGDLDLFESERDSLRHGQKKVVIDPTDDARFAIPGRSIILKQNTQDMGSTRFTWDEANLIASATDLQQCDHYLPFSDYCLPALGEMFGKLWAMVDVYGSEHLYIDSKRANAEVTVSVIP